MQRIDEASAGKRPYAPGRGAVVAVQGVTDRQRAVVHHRRLKAVLHEMETGGIFTACAGSIVNFTSQRPARGASLLAQLPVWMPSEPHMLEAALGALVDVEAVPLPLLNRLQDHARRLVLARDISAIACRTADKLQVDPLTIEDLVSTWGGVADAALDLIQEITPVMTAFASLDGEVSRAAGTAAPAAGQQSNAPSAERLLASVAIGGWPCIDREGRIEIPGWLERRKDRRHRSDIFCLLHHGGRSWPARTVDLSRHGAGLTGAIGVDPGMRAELALGAFRPLPGTVVWRSGDRLGFRFDSPIDNPAAVIAGAGFERA